MSDRVLYIEGFHEIPDKVREYLDKGWTVYNAPRPIYGHEQWQGDFRHGVFFAAVAPTDDPADEFNDAPAFHRRNQELDASECMIVSREQVMAYGEEQAQRHGISLADFSYEDIVESYRNWMARQVK